MHLRTILTTSAVSFFLAFPVFAEDVQVDGYYRSDGTYVRPHTRSAPDDSISNNYGPSQSSDELKNPRSRDYDNDGTPNYLDFDSDNDGVGDEIDSDPYSTENDSYSTENNSFSID